MCPFLDHVWGELLATMDPEDPDAEDRVVDAGGDGDSPGAITSNVDEEQSS